jgi:hypothetical protein
MMSNLDYIAYIFRVSIYVLIVRLSGEESPGPFVFLGYPTIRPILARGLFPNYGKAYIFDKDQLFG